MFERVGKAVWAEAVTVHDSFNKLQWVKKEKEKIKKCKDIIKQEKCWAS